MAALFGLGSQRKFVSLDICDCLAPDFPCKIGAVSNVPRFRLLSL